MENNVFVKYLPSDLDNTDLFNLFASFGVILSAKVMLNISTGKSLGYGFVRFSSNNDALNAITTMTGHKVGNKTLLCKLSDSFSLSDPNPNLYIKPLPLDFTQDKLCEVFSQFGTIRSCIVKKCSSIEGSVVGFVRYTNVKSATNAINKMNGVKIPEQTHLLVVKYAESDTQRAVRKANTLPFTNSTQPHSSQTHETTAQVPSYVQPPASFTQAEQPYGVMLQPVSLVFCLPYQYPVQYSSSGMSYYPGYHTFYPT